MTGGGKNNRRDERKYKRIFVRYGNPEPLHKAVAMQISESGFFLSTNEVVYVKGSPIMVEIKHQENTWTVPGIVRHAVKVPPNMVNFSKPGMGVQFTDIPPPCRDYLASL